MKLDDKRMVDGIKYAMRRYYDRCERAASIWKHPHEDRSDLEIVPWLLDLDEIRLLVNLLASVPGARAIALREDLEAELEAFQPAASAGRPAEK